MLYSLPMSELATETPAITRQASLGQQVASAVRRDIITGKIPAGTALTQASLCETYDVSRIPVRDALIGLANEGLLTRNRRNQMIVTGFSTQDVIDTFKAEAYLSGLAARRAALNANDADIAYLEGLIEQGDNLDAAADKRALARISWNFHHRVNRMADSPRLLATLRAVSIPLLQDFVSELPSWWDASQDEHRAIADALRARNADRVETLIFEHFLHGGDALLAYLSTLQPAVETAV